MENQMDTQTGAACLEMLTKNQMAHSCWGGRPRHRNTDALEGRLQITHHEYLPCTVNTWASLFLQVSNAADQVTLWCQWFTANTFSFLIKCQNYWNLCSPGCPGCCPPSLLWDRWNCRQGGAIKPEGSCRVQNSRQQRETPDWKTKSKWLLAKTVWEQSSAPTHWLQEIKPRTLCIVPSRLKYTHTHRIISTVLELVAE